MTLVMLTEMIDYRPARDQGRFDSVSHTHLLPGLCDAEFLRADMGDDLYDRAVRIGVLVQIP